MSKCFLEEAKYATATVATTIELDPTQIVFPNFERFYLEFLFKSVGGSLIIDTRVIVVGDIILVKDQTDKRLNGVYEITKIDSSGIDPIYTFVRTCDGIFLNPKSLTFIKKGKCNISFLFSLCTNSEIYTLGVSDATFTPMNAFDVNNFVPPPATTETIIANGGVIDPNADIEISEIIIQGGLTTGTLGDPTPGLIGQRKMLIVTDVTIPGSYTINITSFVNGSGVSLSQKGQSLEFIWINSGWSSLGGAGGLLF